MTLATAVDWWAIGRLVGGLALAAVGIRLMPVAYRRFRRSLHR